jgi:formylglycine-generating enzyme required for sulfatase activity
VPAAVRSIPADYGPYADCTLKEALLVDRYEVTRADWLLFAVEGEPDPAAARWRQGAAAPPLETLDWPATWMTREEASAFAARRGMRLLSAREWVHVAVGRSVSPLRYPYGINPQLAWANTAELGLERLAPVGTFESGRSPSGCYDLLGNAAEWVEGWLPGHDEGVFDPTRARTLEGQASAFGGSYREFARPTFQAKKLEFNAATLDPRHRADDVGLRCTADAALYLWAHAGEWGSGPEARRRVAAVGRGWAEAGAREPALRLLEQLAERPAAPEGLLWLLEGLR